MVIIDLSVAIDSRLWEPDPVTHENMSPAAGARHMAAGMRERFGLEFDPAELPDGEFLDIDFIRASTHTGTHVDAPSHYGTKTTYGRPPRTIDQMPLDWFHGPAFVLDLTSVGTGAVDADFIDSAIRKIGYRPAPMDIALLRTGAAHRHGTPEYFTEFTGLDGTATELLLDLGIRVIGTDAFSLDAPFTYIIDQYRQTRDRSVLWPAHFAGRRREYCQIERLANLHKIPPHGFWVSCFPVKIAGAGAGWTRAVAFVTE
jgi:cyclase